MVFWRLCWLSCFVALCMAYQELHVGDDPIVLDPSEAVKAIREGETEFWVGAYHVCDVQIIEFSNHVHMTMDGLEYGWFDDDEDVLFEAHLCGTPELRVTMAIDDGKLHGSIDLPDGAEASLSSDGLFEAHEAAGFEYEQYQNEEVEAWEAKVMEFLAQSEAEEENLPEEKRRKLQSLSPGEVDVHLKLEIDSSMVDQLGSAFAAARYCVELTALINRDAFIDLGFNLVVAEINIHSSRIANCGGDCHRAGLYLRTIQRTPAPANVNLVHALSYSVSGGVAFLNGLYSRQHAYAVSGLSGGRSAGNFGKWDKVVYAHELGHNFGSPHTHAYSPIIDNCGNVYRRGCSSTRSTIMSYCHLCSGGLNNIDYGWHPRVEQLIHQVYDRNERRGRSPMQDVSSCLSFSGNVPDNGLPFVLYRGSTCISGGIDTSSCGSACRINSCRTDAMWYWDATSSRVRSGKNADYCWSTNSGCTGISLQRCSSSSSSQRFTMSTQGVSSNQCGAVRVSGSSVSFSSNNDRANRYCLVGGNPDGSSGGDDNLEELTCNVQAFGRTNSLPRGEKHFSFTATQSSTVTFTTCGSAYDTMLDIQTMSGTRIIQGDDEGDCGRQTVLSINAVAGTTYRIILSGYNGHTGIYTMEAQCPNVPGGGDDSSDDNDRYVPPAGCTCVPVDHPSWGRIDSCVSPAMSGFEPFCYVTGSCAKEPSSSVPGAFWADCVIDDGSDPAVDCVGSWSEYGSCSATCGGGVQSRTYTIITNAENGGSQCPHVNGATQTRTCNNDACPSNVIECGGAVTGSTRGLSSQIGNPSGEATFEFTADGSLVTFDLCGSRFDTYLRILDTSGSEIAYNDDHGNQCDNPRHNYASFLEVQLQAGVYTVVVEGYNSNEGDFELDVKCGSADGDDENTIACGETVRGSTRGQSSSIGSRSGEMTYQFVATSTEYTFDACQSTYDSLLRVYSGAPSSGNQIASNDDHRGRCPRGSRRTASHLTVSTTVGQTYTLLIEGYGRSEGSYVVTAQCGGQQSGPMDLCGHTCAQVVDAMAPCTSTWSEGCGSQTPPPGFTADSTLFDLCPAQCPFEG